MREQSNQAFSLNTTLPRSSSELSLRAVEDILREAEWLASRHDGMHNMHSSRACLQTLIHIGRKMGRMTERESETARSTIAEMRYAARFGTFPKWGGRRQTARPPG